MKPARPLGVAPVLFLGSAQANVPVNPE
jgi:hypothetical protein